MEVRSAPATKSFFFEVMITPFTFASLIAPCTFSANMPTDWSLSTFMERSTMFQAMVAMPSASTEYSIMFLPVF